MARMFLLCLCLLMAASQSGAMLPEPGGEDGSFSAANLGQLTMGVYIASGDNFLTYAVDTGDDSAKSYDGFEIDLMKEMLLVELAAHNASVKMLLLPTPDSRIEALQNGTVDFVMGSFYVTPEREEVVDFIKPYYYSSGAALFTPGGVLPGVKNWTDLAGQTVAAVPVHFTIPYLNASGINVLETANRSVAADAIRNGEALAFVNVDSSSCEDVGLSIVQDIPLIMIRPVGIAVAKGSVTNYSVLAVALQDGLISMIQGGKNATIIQIEMQALEDANMDWIKPNKDLENLVEHPEESTLLWPKD